ncbi:MAG: threonine dehydratase [Vicinamibacterales bacterium]|nr:threonine dehydratase [Vicinamibacterales bacterium]
MTVPTLHDVYDARTRVYRTLRPTPLLRHPLLAGEIGADVIVKHENHNPTGAFKIRGGLNLVSSLGADDRARGIVTASTGNHGQSLAMACELEQVPCTIYVPVGNNPEKNAAMRGFGATVVEIGRDFDEARERCEREAQARGYRYVHPANEPLLLAGVATYALEIFEAAPRADVVFVPVGGGSGAFGLVTVRSALGAPARIVGVQAERADTFARAWRTGDRTPGAQADTFAEGLATRVTFDMTFAALTRELDDVVTLTERELEAGIRMALRTTHNLAEGAGAAALAAAFKMRQELDGKCVVCVMSGGNLDSRTLARILGGRSPGPSGPGLCTASPQPPATP